MQHLDFPVKYLGLLKDIIREQIPDAEIWAFWQQSKQAKS